MSYPAYIEAYKNGRLKDTAEKAARGLFSCAICPRKCGVNRLENERGFCKTGLRARIFSFMAHHGEEPPISGSRGSGTIFFSGCNMNCAYCQNFEFSQQDKGREASCQELADIMLKLQGSGCHNINLVTPTHVMPQILQSLVKAVPAGLKIPLVYNTGGYELPEMIRLLEGIVDIYLPDMRYAIDSMAIKYSSAPGYLAHNRNSVKEMHRQVGIVKMDKEGIIKKGLIVRHLVLPEGLSATDATMDFIANEISEDTYVSLMSQYTPYNKAAEFPELSRRITAAEYEAAREDMEKHGLYNGWTQASGGMERLAGINIKQVME